MNIRFIGIDGSCGYEVDRIFSYLEDFDFIKSVEIRNVQSVIYHGTIYDVTVEIDPGRYDISVHIYDDVIHIVGYRGGIHKACINLDRSAYERLEII